MHLTPFRSQCLLHAAPNWSKTPFISEKQYNFSVVDSLPRFSPGYIQTIPWKYLEYE